MLKFQVHIRAAEVLAKHFLNSNENSILEICGNICTWLHIMLIDHRVLFSTVRTHVHASFIWNVFGHIIIVQCAWHLTYDVVTLFAGMLYRGVHVKFWLALQSECEAVAVPGRHPSPKIVWNLGLTYIVHSEACQGQTFYVSDWRLPKFNHNLSNMHGDLVWIICFKEEHFRSFAIGL